MTIRTVTAATIKQDLDVNLQDLSNQLKDCLPLAGQATLSGDFDAGGAYIKNAKNGGTNSAYSNLINEVLPDPPAIGGVDLSTIVNDFSTFAANVAASDPAYTPATTGGPILRATNLTNGAANIGSLSASLTSALTDTTLSPLDDKRSGFVANGFNPPFTLFGDGTGITDLYGYSTPLSIFAGGFTASWHFAWRFTQYFDFFTYLPVSNKMVAAGAPCMLLYEDANNYLYVFSDYVGGDHYTIELMLGGQPYTAHVAFEHYRRWGSYFGPDKYQWHGGHHDNPNRILPQDIPVSMGDAYRQVHRVMVWFDPATATSGSNKIIKLAVNDREVNVLMRPESSGLTIPAFGQGMSFSTQNPSTLKDNTLYGGFSLFDRPLSSTERGGSYFLWY